MLGPRDVLTPEALAMLQNIAAAGSFAAAARAGNLVPSALTYRVRRMEEALGVLLFERSVRRARLTEAGAELLREGAHLLAGIDAVAARVKRVATGWEAQFTIAVDSIIDRNVLMQLCEAFFRLDSPTRLHLRDETLSGTLEALTSGQADLALGTTTGAGEHGDYRHEPLGSVQFVYAVAPHHPLAKLPGPLADETIRRYRAVAVADSVQRGGGLTHGLFDGQDIFTVANMPAKLDAQVRGLGAGFLPIWLARPYLETGRLVEKKVERRARRVQAHYAWRRRPRGRALAWWLERLSHRVTRAALLGERTTHRR